MAQTKLGAMYEHGRGVPQDKVSAYMWYSLGVEGGDMAAAIQRDAVAKTMSATQIDEALERAREYAEPRSD